MIGPTVIASLAIGRRQTLRVALDKHAGVDLIDLRVMVDLTETTGIRTPTKRGVALRVGVLPALIAALLDAEAMAAELGWLPEVGP